MPDTPPFYAQPGQASLWTAMRKVSDVLGLADVCERPACRRGRCCRAESRRDLPPCVWEHRGVVRFFTILVQEPGYGATGDLDDPGEVADPAPTASTARTARPDGRDLRLIAFLRSRCQPVGTAPKDEWVWENDPQAVALYDALRGRKPGRGSAGHG